MRILPFHPVLEPAPSIETKVSEMLLAEDPAVALSANVVSKDG